MGYAYDFVIRPATTYRRSTDRTDRRHSGGRDCDGDASTDAVLVAEDGNSDADADEVADPTDSDIHASVSPLE